MPTCTGSLSRAPVARKKVLSHVCVVPMPCQDLEDERVYNIWLCKKGPGTNIIDENINIIIYTLTNLGKTNRGISVKITNQSVFGIDSWNDEILVVKKWIMEIISVELMYE